MAVGHSYFPPIRLGWPTLVAVCLLFITGFPGDLARSFGEDATLNDVLQLFDEHYGMVMTFDTISKELYSLKQGSEENVAEFWVCLSQQVQILQSEYQGRITQEHVEEMKWDFFYEGLNPKYWCILAHKVDGEHPASYSNLDLAAQKLERWVLARDALLLKISRAGGLTITQPQTLGNLFPSRKLKGNHTFMAQSAIVESIGAEEDSSVKPEGEEEAESSDGEDPETLIGIGGADQPVGYIVRFANVVKLYQEINWNCLGCSSERLSEGSQQDCLKSEFKHERGDGKEGRLSPSETSSCSTSIPSQGIQGLKMFQKSPSWAQMNLISGTDLRT